MRDTGSRVAWLMGVTTVALLVLAVQLYRLTVSETAVWRMQAEGNMLRKLPSYGPRGVITDQKGRSLAVSEPAFAAVLINQDAQKVGKFLPALSVLLADGNAQKAKEIETSVLERLAEKKAAGLQYEPLTVQRKLSQAAVTALLERSQEFPGIQLVQESSRVYPQGSLAGALLGYVGIIGQAELKDPAFSEYHVDEIIGKDGLEAQYEHELRGKPGTSAILVDPLGRRVGGFQEAAPVPGNNLKLSLDLDLQRVAEQALVKQMEWMKQQNDPHSKPVRGALVAQDVRTGAILAMASVPTYDPNAMVRGLTAAEWQNLQSKPGALVNWAIKGFAPGSTYKMATGMAGMEAGVLGPYQQIDCPHTYWRPPYPKNWYPVDQGPADVGRALAISCNPFFWEVGYNLGIDRLAEFNARFGFGQTTGIDLPDEEPGVNPTQATYGKRWNGGEVLNVSIGQGDVLVTPLQLANFTAAIATGGTRYKPYLVDEVRSPAGQVLSKHIPEQLPKVQGTPDHWLRLQQGMRQTVTSGEGTAYLPMLGFPIATAAKTGSAETSTGYAHALSVVYAPYDNPQIAVSVIIEGGGTGSWTTPVIRRVLAQYFGIKDKFPPESPTYKDQ